MPLNQWASANILSFALIESCALFAVVLHMSWKLNKTGRHPLRLCVAGSLRLEPGCRPATENFK